MIDSTSAAGRPSPRERTREEILEIIQRTGSVTRADLCKMTGLSSSTVGYAVGRLLEEGRIEESGISAGGKGTGSGRRAGILTAVRKPAILGAIDFGHSHFQVAVGTEDGHVIAEMRVSTNVDDSPSSGLDYACDALLSLCARHHIDALAGVGVGVPGPVERSTGIIRTTTILSNWSGMSPAAEVERRLSVRAVADNDANVGALGELTQGAGRRLSDFLYIKAGHGIGAALVLQGQLYRGGTGFAGEIGHFPLHGRAEVCRCGSRGCLEAVISVHAVTEQILHTRPQTSDTIAFGSLSDPVAARIFNQAGYTLGTVLAEFLNLVNPRAIIIGGGLGSAGPAFIDGVRASVHRFAQAPLASVCDVQPAQLGQRAELLGALALAGTLVSR